MSSHPYAAAEEAIVELILESNPEVKSIERHQDLIESRLVDSLQFVELIVIIEDALGREVDMTTLSANDFRSIDAIARSFFLVEHSATA